MDFTLKMYALLIERLKKNQYSSPTMAEFIENKLWQKNGYHCVLRHDIDIRRGSIKEMAKIENINDTKATYYVRYVPEVYEIEYLKKVESLGHEIGYHYETLDKEKGDINKAYELFMKELFEIRKDFKIRTICMHGHSLNPWRNLDIWNNYNYHDFDLIGEPYRDIDYLQVAYFTDTGRSWSSKVKVKDNVPDDNFNVRHNINPTTTEDLINIINSKKIRNMVILTHPNRWTDNIGEWIWEFSFEKTKNVGKRFLQRRK